MGGRSNIHHLYIIIHLEPKSERPNFCNKFITYQAPNKLPRILSDGVHLGDTWPPQLNTPVTLKNASDYLANGLLSDYIGWTNGLGLGVRYSPIV